MLGGCGRDFYQPVDIFFDCIDCCTRYPQSEDGRWKPQRQKRLWWTREGREQIGEGRGPRAPCASPTPVLSAAFYVSSSAAGDSSERILYLTYFLLCHPINFLLARALLCSKVSLQRLCRYVCIPPACKVDGPISALAVAGALATKAAPTTNKRHLKTLPTSSRTSHARTPARPAAEPPSHLTTLPPPCPFCPFGYPLPSRRLFPWPTSRASSRSAARYVGLPRPLHAVLF